MTKRTIENGQMVTHVVVAGGIVFHVLGSKDSIVKLVNDAIFTLAKHFFVNLDVVEDSGEINTMHVNPNSIDFVADEHPWEVAQGHEVTL